jgi:hypothetical protein
MSGLNDAEGGDEKIGKEEGEEKRETCMFFYYG